MRIPALAALLFVALTTASCAPRAEPVAHVARPPIDVVAELQKQWPNNRTVTIVAFGNSVPAGYAKTPVVRQLDSYPHLLRIALNEAYPYAVVNVVVSAVGGETSEQGIARMHTTVLGYLPDVVLVDYGLNDRSIGLERSRAAHRAIIRTAKEAGARVMLLTPTGDSSANLDDPADPLNTEADMLRKLAADEGVILVDSLALWKAYPGEKSELYAQVNHPSRKGHELVARELAKVFGAAPAP